MIDLQRLYYSIYNEIKYENDVFINRLSPYLPNNPVNNDEMEDYLGLIEGKASRVKRIVLRQNGINTRYYALNKSRKLRIPMRS